MLRVRVELTGWDGAPGLMTIYFETPLQNTAAATRVVANVRTYMNSPLASYWPSSVNAQVSGDVDVIDAATGAITDTLSVTPPAIVNGAGTAAFAPVSTAALLRLITSTYIAGRRVRGRVFISPLTPATIGTDGNLDAGAAVDLGDRMGYLEDLLDAGDFTVVWHRPKGGAGGQACRVTSTTAGLKMAVLTSRRD